MFNGRGLYRVEASESTTADRRIHSRGSYDLLTLMCSFDLPRLLAHPVFSLSVIILIENLLIMLTYKV
jgi:hypothetical protein